ncbi:MAG: hypothetical protein HXY23_14420 [Parvularculaceae bacterium]|nr:hypothetical protein [Parvularculaceae bacterium]
MITARPIYDGEDLAGQVLLVRVRCRAVHAEAKLACVRLVDSPRFGGTVSVHVIDIAAIAGVEIDPPQDEALVPR